jgi:hypothetical protein
VAFQGISGVTEELSSSAWRSYLGIRERPYVNLFLIKIALISITHANLIDKQ